MNEGLELGHAMASVAADHAGTEWKRIAYEAFVTYAKNHPYFVTEDVRATNSHLPAPPDKRAWGQIALTAKREGIVFGHSLVRAKSRTVHGMIVTMWKSKICTGTPNESLAEVAEVDLLSH